MKILSWNVNGLRAIVKKNFLEFIENENPNILGIQETKLQKEQIPKEISDIGDYHKFWNFAQRKGYSGTSIFTKNKPLSVSYSLPDERFNSEGRNIIAEYQKFYLINCYFPNGQMNEDRLQFKLDFYDNMFELMEKLRKKGKPVIVCGDYNTAHKPIDLKNPKPNEKRSGFLPIERAWIDKIIANGWVDTFRMFNQKESEYSWWSYRFKARKNNAGWRIDYFFINEEFKDIVIDAFILQNIPGSDHCPVGIEINI